MKKTIYVLGNPLEKIDSQPIKLIPYLRKLFPKINFIVFDPTEEFLPELDNELILIDTVVGINKVNLLNDLKHFTSSSSISVHDYDLFINLKLLHKLGKIKKVAIIGIPPNYPINQALKETQRIITNFEQKF